MVSVGLVLTLVACGSHLSDDQLRRALPSSPSWGAGTPHRAGETLANAAPATPVFGHAVAPGATAAGTTHTVAGPARPLAVAGAGKLPVDTVTGAGGAGGSSASVKARPAPARGTPLVNRPAPAAPASAGRPAGAPAGAVVSLGTLGPRSGPVGAALAPLFAGMRSWVADVNARGGLAGRHRVVLIEADDRGDPNQSLALARRLVEQDGVLAFYGLHTVTTSEVVMRYLEQRQVPVIASCLCIPQVAESPMLFDVGDHQVDGGAWEHIGPVIEAGERPNLALLHCREAATCSLLADRIKGLARRAGLAVVYEAQISIAQPDFTAEVIQARQSAAGAVVVVADNATVIRVARSAHRQSYRPIIALPRSSDDRFPVDGGPDVEGAYTATPVSDWTSSPLMEDYRSALRRYVPGGIRGGLGPVVWTGGKLIERLAETFPPQPTTSSFLDALDALRDETLGGRIAPTTYARDGRRVAMPACSVPLRVEGATFVAFKGPSFFSCPPG